MKVGVCVEKGSVNSKLHFISDSTKTGQAQKEKKGAFVKNEV